ncbi:MAG: hypothetical protein A2885_13330 [Sphingopyxis sp. RIFCSPHIGHO2_01_FULL_65_24]|jgi:hypothetical protein|nr:MAG: hypothetical protein A2885_13330 [Sphingopyxis sp. RIFCSPHIGHO2_01_FULL_65_24]
MNEKDPEAEMTGADKTMMERLVMANTDIGGELVARAWARRVARVLVEISPTLTSNQLGILIGAGGFVVRAYRAELAAEAQADAILAKLKGE